MWAGKALENIAMKPVTSRDLLAGAGFLGLCLAVSAVGGLATASSVGSWYQTLEKPPFNPPDWVFGPVWTTLYLMMAVAGWRVWRVAGFNAARPAFLAYAVQLALNLAWSVIFFGLQMPGLAFLELGGLLVAIVVTAILFHRHDRIAGLLFVPYAAWVTFAGILNGAIWRLN